MTGMGCIKLVVKAPEQNRPFVIRMVREYTEELFRQGILFDTVVIVKSRLGAPADMEGRMNIGLAPLHDLAKLIPVVHILKFQLFHRCAGNDHAVKFPVLQLIEALIKGQHMLL